MNHTEAGGWAGGWGNAREMFAGTRGRGTFSIVKNVASRLCAAVLRRNTQSVQLSRRHRQLSRYLRDHATFSRLSQSSRPRATSGNRLRARHGECGRAVAPVHARVAEAAGAACDSLLRD